MVFAGAAVEGCGGDAGLCTCPVAGVGVFAGAAVDKMNPGDPCLGEIGRAHV